MWNDFVRFLNPCKIEVVLTTYYKIFKLKSSTHQNYTLLYLSLANRDKVKQILNQFKTYKLYSKYKKISLPSTGPWFLSLQTVCRKFAVYFQRTSFISLFGTLLVRFCHPRALGQPKANNKAQNS